MSRVPYERDDRRSESAERSFDRREARKNDVRILSEERAAALAEVQVLRAQNAALLLAQNAALLLAQNAALSTERGITRGIERYPVKISRKDNTK